MKKGLKIYDLRFKIFLIFFVLFINHKSLFINPVFAAESSPSADIKTKVQQFIKDSASKAAQLKKELEKSLQNRAYVGKIIHPSSGGKTKSDATITLASKNGPRIININQDSEFESQVKGKKYSQKLISEEDYVAALGDIDETQVLTAKKIILLPKPKETNKAYLWGQVAAISDRLITLKTRDLKNVSVSLDQKVKLNDFVILTGVKNKNEIFEADFLYVIPQGGFLKPKKISTPSAQIATKSAHPLTSERSDGERARPASR